MSVPQYAASVVIPALNEEAGIAAVLHELRAVGEFDVIVVDDGSADRTAAVAEQSGARVVRHRRTKGYGAALKTGISAARHPTIVTMDADGQHNAADVPALLRALESCDLASGLRTADSHTAWSRKPGKFVLGYVANYLSGSAVPDLNCGFRAMHRDAVRQFFHFLPDGFSFSTTVLLATLKGGGDVTFVPVTTRRRIGTSGVRPLRDGMSTVLLIIRTITLFDPLKVFLPVSVAMFLLAVLYTTWAIALQRSLHFPAGAVVLFVSGVVILMFGILADQISAIRRGAR